MLHALGMGEEKVARAFMYGGLFSLFSASIFWVALSSRKPQGKAQSELVTLFIGWLVLPAFAAIPVIFLTPRIGVTGAWFEMIAALTTTGSTVYIDPNRVDISIHLWRAIVAWLGGLMTLMAAYVILAPRRMGGFEVLTGSSGTAAGVEVRLVELGAQMPPVESRVARAFRTILPVYGGLTGALIMLFGMVGGVSMDTVIHALGIVSTSGITALPEGLASAPNLGIEAIALMGMICAATARLYGNASRVGARVRLTADPELRLMAWIVLGASAALFLRHWLAALGQDDDSEIEALTALWGAIFTTLSFLTTTGYESASWEGARTWAGLDNPSLILLGLAAIGGGAATTAGGIKLVRAAALIRHGLDEIGQLAQPMAINPRRGIERRLGVASARGTVVTAGAFLSWAFIMLYVGAVFAVALALAVTGLPFETSLIGAIAAVSNTGPAFGAVAPLHDNFALMTAPQQLFLAIGMVAGRIETLALIALMRREAWSGMLATREKAGNRVI
ncbi:MAG: potassium transporter TrkG [Pseudomonadota bacterium]